jgi:hypothetical protein
MSESVYEKVCNYLDLNPDLGFKQGDNKKLYRAFKIYPKDTIRHYKYRWRKNQTVPAPDQMKWLRWLYNYMTSNMEAIKMRTSIEIKHLKSIEVMLGI